MVPRCEYSGDDFALAQDRAVASGGTIYESNAKRGLFLVLTDAQRGAMFPLGLPADFRNY